MFTALRNYLQNLKINIDYPQYELKARAEYERNAESKFSTKHLTAKKLKLTEVVNREASIKFDQELIVREKKKQAIEKRAIEIENLLSYFLKYYRAEINELYCKKDALLIRKKALYEEIADRKHTLSEAFDDKRNAYDDLDYYKSEISAWYSKSSRSTWLFGNSGKKLPRHALFGQSFGDLESLKTHRDNAYSKVVSVKDDIERLKHDQSCTFSAIEDSKKEIKQIHSKIKSLKCSRSKMYELKGKGFTKQRLAKQLDELRNTITIMEEEISLIAKEKIDFIEMQEVALGIKDIEKRVIIIELHKKQFLKKFDSEDNKKIRRLNHRKAWLSKRGKR